MSSYPSKREQEQMRKEYWDSLKTHKLDKAIDDNELYLSSYYLKMYRILNAIDNEEGTVQWGVWLAELDSEREEYKFEDMILDFNLAENCLKYDTWYEFAEDNDIRDLKYILRSYHLDESGEKNELIERIIKHEILLEDEVDLDSRLTSDGRLLLDELKWIEIYDSHLTEFNFEDFYRFCLNTEGDLKKISLNYLDQHLKLANASDDKSYLIDCKNSKRGITNLWNNDLEIKLNTSANSEPYKKVDEFLKNHFNSKIEENSADDSIVQIDEIEFCKMADNKPRLIPREDDYYHMPVDLNRYKLYKMVEEYNDADLALLELSFVPLVF